MRSGTLVGVIVAVGLWPVVVLADVAPPNTSGCQGKTAGDACKDDQGADGVCEADTCSRFDYANWDEDTQSRPPTKTYDCLKCVPGAAPDTVANGTDATAQDGIGADDTAGGSAKVAEEDGGGCAAGPVGAGAGAVLAGLFAFVGALVARRRRSRRT